MFRELLLKNKEISYSECIELLVKENRGVLSVNGDNDYPYAMPMNHYYNSEDWCIYFHCSKKGNRIDSVRVNDKACFCVVEDGVAIDGDWGLTVRSVIVFGKVEIIEDISIISDITYKLSCKFTDDEEYIQNEISRFADVTALLKLTPQNICGKRVKES